MKNKHLGLSVHLIMCAAELIIGVLLLINPVGFTRGIIIAFGVLLALQGIDSIVKYMRDIPEAAAEGNLLSKGLLMTCAGLFCMFRSGWFLVTFPALTKLYGIMALVCGFGKLQWAVDLLRFKQKRWFVALIGAGLSLGHAILIMTNPFGSAATLWIFIGTALIAEAIIDAVTLVFENK